MKFEEKHERAWPRILSLAYGGAKPPPHIRRHSRNSALLLTFARKAMSLDEHSPTKHRSSIPKSLFQLSNPMPHRLPYISWHYTKTNSFLQEEEMRRMIFMMLLAVASLTGAHNAMAQDNMMS